MQHDLPYPNLPDHNVGLVLVKNEIATVKALEALGIRVLSPERHPLLPAEVAEHADMLCCCIAAGQCVVEPGQTKLKAALEALGFTVYFSRPLQKDYPGDVVLNVALAGEYAIGNFRYADQNILNGLNNKKRINIRQGYAKCSLCIVSENTFITEDTGVAKALRENGMNVLLISPGDVYLSEEHSGFLGGATGKLSRNRLAINGSLSRHRDGERIRDFLLKNGVEPVELFPGRIQDIGGIIPLKEEQICTP